MPAAEVPAEPAPTVDQPAGVEPDHRWVAAAVGRRRGVRRRDRRSLASGRHPVAGPARGDLRLPVAISLGLFVVLAGRGRVRAAPAAGPAARRLLETAACAAGPGDGCARRWQALLAYHLVYFCYHNLKSWDVLNQPARRRCCSRWDRWLFLGHSPAVLLHDLLGQHVAAYVLVVVYESFSHAGPVRDRGCRWCFVDPDPGRLRRSIASALWVWILGVACYYLIPSLGPFYSAPQEFAGLPHTMVQDTQARYLAQRAHLLAHPHAARRLRAGLRVREPARRRHLP